jgi:hypothetical protein
MAAKLHWTGRSATLHCVRASPVPIPEPQHRYPRMTTAPTDRILRQGKALVRAIEALGTIEPSDPFGWRYRRVAAAIRLPLHG